jgi:hypothetical protein
MIAGAMLDSPMGLSDVGAAARPPYSTGHPIAVLDRPPDRRVPGLGQSAVPLAQALERPWPVDVVQPDAAQVVGTWASSRARTSARKASASGG